MTNFKSRKEVEAMAPTKGKTHYTGEIYREIISPVEIDDSGSIPLDAAILWLGSFRLEGGLFPK